MFLLLTLGTHLFGQLHYQIAARPWPESFGNHRAVLQVSEPAERVMLDFTWRRHDPKPEEKELILVDAETGDTIPVIHRLEVNQEKCRMVFGPVARPGVYYFYYLPYLVQEGWGFYGRDYLRPTAQDPKTISDLQVQNEEKSLVAMPEAAVLHVEARTAFDSFYPMEVIALKAEKDSLLSQHSAPVQVFVEDRSFPIRMQDEIPHKWITDGPSTNFKGQAGRNEYYTFQAGIWAAGTSIHDIEITYDQTPEVFAGITCFNEEGVDPYGTPFTKTIPVDKGHVQALWFGFDLPENILSGTYSGRINLKFLADQPVDPVSIIYRIEVTDTLFTDRGDSEPWRHSRLRWLNSTAGIDDETVAPYDPIRISGEDQYQTSSTLLTKAVSGLPAQLTTRVNILAEDLRFSLRDRHEILQFSYRAPEMVTNKPGLYQWSQQWDSESVSAQLESSLEFDGYQHYTITLTSKEFIHLEDIFLEIPFDPEVADYMMGMNLPGCAVPEHHETQWEKPQDAFWVGNTEGGLWCEIRGSSYHGPLLNLYKPGHPRPWYNDNHGYLSLEKTHEATLARVGTGASDLEAGETMVFSFAILPTPVKKLDSPAQFTNRYYHSGAAPEAVEEELRNGIRVVNIHHANQYNPYINYPFIAVDELHQIVEQYHASDLKVKLYYTIRELTNHVTEIWALRSLGDEIFRDGGGGGYPWLREHLIAGYYPQWYQHFENLSPDASLLTATTASRWYNYYVEGLRWLLQNQHIDGLYLDDVSYDRRMLKRMRKVMEETRPGCLIDLHSNTGFSIGPAIQYTEFFPYVDKLWFGESFQYNTMSPENWLVEVSGIPFGLMGDMLHGGGNRWLGMLFGMTVRLPWTSEGNTADPRPVWKLWDQFSISEARMIGFWEANTPVTLIQAETGKAPELVKATVYQKPGESLIVIGNFSDQQVNIQVLPHWKDLDLDPMKSSILIPEIQGFQEQKRDYRLETLSIPSKKGKILWIKAVN